MGSRIRAHLGIAALSAGLLGSSGAPSAECAPPVTLASSVRSAHRPTSVLVHGLDSSRETWKSTIGALAVCGYPAVALDLRGHGESPLGGVSDFSPTTLAEDVLSAIASLGLERVVLVGHSMGGRIAMRAAALALESAKRAGSVEGTPPAHRLIASVVIEDMDLRLRAAPPPLSPSAEASLGRFGDGGRGRSFESFEACAEALLPWYPDASRVAGWRGTRVRQRADGRWWSDISPLAQRLARERVLCTADGADAWAALGEAAAKSALPFSVHVWYADGPDSACVLDGAGGVSEMARTLPSAGVRLFGGASHSIHGSHADAFEGALCALVDAHTVRGADD
jgi:pimeloyl-ACP methyl ester carboxylesterase